MSIVKIQRVKHLSEAISYCMQDYKTESGLITTNLVQPDDLENDFKRTLDKYNLSNGTNKEMFARMIIQSFSDEDNITPELAHEIGVELANTYLNDKHSYMVVTHEETTNLHNHIIFNSIEYESLKMFDSKTKHTKHDLRADNDNLTLKYKLSIPKIEINKGMNFNEYVARSKNKSFKSKLETVIDETIKHSSSYTDFLNKMEVQGYPHKEGKYLSFLNTKSDKYMRTKRLGMNYFPDSIKYRIQDKQYEPIKHQIFEKKWIDKNNDKFKNNIGLRRWASKQNLNYLNEIGNKLYKEKIDLTELSNKESDLENLVEKFEKKIAEYDDTIYKLEKMKNCFSDYKSSQNLINDYKNSVDKISYKKEHYSDFKKFDIAKKNINFLKKEYGANDEDSLKKLLKSFREDREEFYKGLNTRENNRKMARSKEEQKQSKGNDLTH